MIHSTEKTQDLGDGWGKRNQELAQQRRENLPALALCAGFGGRHQPDQLDQDRQDAVDKDKDRDDFKNIPGVKGNRLSKPWVSLPRIAPGSLTLQKY